jgi:hypothetical protein
MEQKLNGACNYAKEGNRSLMDYKLGEARKDAGKAGALDAAYYKRESQVRNSLKNERNFHLAQMEQQLNGACNYAKEGDRFMMDFKLGSARKHAEAVGALNVVYHARVSKIRCSLCTGVVKTETL